MERDTEHTVDASAVCSTQEARLTAVIVSVFEASEAAGHRLEGSGGAAHGTGRTDRTSQSRSGDEHHRHTSTGGGTLAWHGDTRGVCGPFSW